MSLKVGNHMIYIKNALKNIWGVFVFLRFKTIWNLKEYLVQNKKQSGISASVYSHYLDKKGSYIGITSKFANPPYFPHGILGIFISDHATIGKNAVIFQQVTIGSIETVGSKHAGTPTIGDNCYIGAGAKILGGIHVGKNCRIGANAVVTKDMPDNSIAIAGATTIIQKEEDLDNHFYVKRPDGTMEYFENGSFHKGSHQ